MGLFDKKRKHDSNKRERTVLTTLDGDVYFSLINPDFIGKFDEEQKKELAFAMEKNLPHQAYAYEELPACYMKCINKCASMFPLQAIDIWKVVNAGLEYPQFDVVMHALVFGLKMVDEIPVIRVYDTEILELAYTVFSRTKKNLCSMITPTMDKDAFKRKCEKIIERQDKHLEQAVEMEKYSNPLRK